jgi:hypothetical protein
MGMSQRRLRFRLWHLLLGFTIAAIGLWAIPSLAEWYAWRNVKVWLDSSISEFESNPAKQHMYELFDGTRSYVISNYEAKWNENPNRITIYESPAREGAYFVMPPEKWAKDSEEALQLLKKHYSDR